MTGCSKIRKTQISANYDTDILIKGSLGEVFSALDMCF